MRFLKNFSVIIPALIISLFFVASTATAVSPQETCENQGGFWNAKDNKCLSAQDSCTDAGGDWDDVKKSCDTSAITGANAPKIRACLGSSGLWDGTTCREAGSQTVTGTIKNIINILLFVAGMMAVIVIVVSGLRFVLSNGEQQQITSARNGITYALIGLVVAVSAYAIVNFVVENI